MKSKKTNKMVNEYLSFWQWFVESRHQIETITSGSSIVADIDRRITALGDFVWEVGPGKVKSSSFTLSPGGDVNLLSKAKVIVSYSPNLEDWEFYYARQEKTWSNIVIVSVDNERISIDVSQWKYVLFKYEDLTFDVLLKPSPWMPILEQEITGISEMIIDNIVGEELRLLRLPYIEVVRDFDADIDASSSHLINFKEHINSLLK
ncbi:MAG: hypothetical protein J0I32_07935 [Sphingobacteriales bacterium]|nr:hypothetical protein [Sphingobacteriales bacterium]OJW03538.1 MAG: hypothetical protein BGO52_15200 [Sphingobacteriales bacterium 44-61]